MNERAGGVRPAEDCTSIEDVRRGIDALDREIVALISERPRYVEAAAKFKADAADVRAPERQRAMLEERRRGAEEEGLSPEFIQVLYEPLISCFISGR